MFSQVGAVLRHPGAVSPLGPLVPKRVIAVGESQSAFRMVTYVNAVHPVADVYDGFLIHSRGSNGAVLSESPQPSIPTPLVSNIRSDTDVPVLMFETETDLVVQNPGFPGYFPARQPDAGNIRAWEVAGTAHDDAYGLSVGPNDAGKGALDTTYLPPVTSIFGIFSCGSAINAGPQHYVLSSAVAHLDKWVRTGRVRGPSSPRLQVAAGPPAAIERDALGNALGGIRTPQVDVPIAALSGQGQTGSVFCFLFGTTVPFDAPTLASLYPSHASYVAQIKKAVRRAVHGGWVLAVDAKAIRAAAAASTIGN
jgi:hypothetical protein